MRLEPRHSQSTHHTNPEHRPQHPAGLFAYSKAGTSSARGPATSLRSQLLLLFILGILKHAPVDGGLVRFKVLQSALRDEGGGYRGESAILAAGSEA